MEIEQKLNEQERIISDEVETSQFDFSSQYTDNFPGILKLLNISLAMTSYQSHGVILVRTPDGKIIDTRFKSFPRPMGIYADEERITLGTYNQVVEFKKNNVLLEKIKQGAIDDANKFTRKLSEKDQQERDKLNERREQEITDVKEADSLYLHRASLTTGMINIHDIAWGDEGLWVVNSIFSCLSTLSPEYSFVARWKPEFISELVPEDRCHLNGMAMEHGRPKYVTTFNMEDSIDSWSEGRVDFGMLIDIDTNERLMSGLLMPHSPKVHKGSVYVCESGHGKVWKYDPNTKTRTKVVTLRGFTRGLFFYDDLMFVGTSKSRRKEVEDELPIDKKFEETYAGIWIINLQTNEEVAHIIFDGDVAQIYDITIIPGSTMPEILDVSSALTRHLFDYEVIQ